MNHPFGGHEFQLTSQVERFFNESQPSERYFFDHTLWDQVVSLSDKPEHSYAPIDLREVWQSGFAGQGRIQHGIEEFDHKFYAGRSLVEVETTTWFLDKATEQKDYSKGRPWPQILCP